MADPRSVNAMMSALIDGTYGCFDAAAETIKARWGSKSCKGTISKKSAGHLDWTVADVIALEDGAGRFPVTRSMARRLNRSNVVGSEHITHHVGSVAKESGEAVAAVLKVQHSADAGDRAKAIQEVDEALTALRHLQDRLESGA